MHHRTLVMGIVNVTADSFSDGGRWLEPQAALAHARELVAEGADLIDVGGESTRPGAERVSEADELARVVPLVERLAAEGVDVSVDTMRASVAEASAQAGAAWINDVSGGQADPAMLPTVARSGVGFIAMHWRGFLTADDNLARYDDVVAEVTAELAAIRDQALAAGIAPEKLVLDPGIGFSKDPEHNWALLRHLDAIESLGHPVLLGVSRKRFLGALLADADGPRDPVGRSDATTALTVVAAQRRLWAVRTHRVRPERDAIAVVEALREPA